jgi:triosephosphate isomerase
MRQKLIAGNWKMNLDRAQCEELARQIVRGADGAAELAICPPYVYLESVGRVTAQTEVALGAQNVYHEGSGAFTGEISPDMLVDLGCQYVIVGHSERRQLLGESDLDVSRKAMAVLHRQMVPIICVGETLPQRDAGLTLEVIENQFRGSLAGIPALRVRELVLAYEPVWAIGTGKVATPEQAQEVHAALRKLLRTHYNDESAGAVRLLYGGSVKAANAAALLACPDIDGALVGGASLTANAFLAIAAAAT